ncbi:MAG: WD40 repeat domain-containing protein [Pirellulales bacterium]
MVDATASKLLAVPIGAHDDGAASLSWRPDGAIFATGGHDGRVKFWDAATARQAGEVEFGRDWIGKVVYHPRRSDLAVAAGRIIRVLSEEGQVVYESAPHDSTIADVEWSPDGSGLAVAAYNGVSLHVPGRLPRPRRFEWKGSSLTLAWSPEGRYIATGEQDSTVHFWDVKSGKDCQMWGFSTKVRELAWYRTGDYLVTGGGESVVMWDCRGKGPQGKTPRMFEGHLGRVTQLCFQRRGDSLASADVDGVVMLWTPLQSSSPLDGRAFASEVTRLSWSPDDQRLAVGLRNGIVSVLSVA